MKFLNLFLCLIIAYTPCYGVTGTLGQKSINSIVQYTLNSPDKAGIIQAYAGSTAPVGWMKAEGQVLEKATYPELFANIGSTWDVFNHPVDGLPTVGGTQFAIPNLKGLYLGGVGANGDSTLLLAGFADDLTGKNGLSNAISLVTGVTGTNLASLVTGVDGTLDSGALTGTVNSTGSTHTHTTTFGQSLVAAGGGAGVVDNVGDVYTRAGGATTSTSAHTHGFSGSVGTAWSQSGTGSAAAQSWSQSGTGSAAAQVISGDAETRPKTAPVTYIIKLYDDAASGSVYIEPASLTTTGVVYQNEIFNIGDIKQSILTEAQFQARNGTDWVAMKGQSVAGTKICIELSLCTLPDARSRFLRNSDAADTNLRSLVADSTAKNGLDLSGSVSGGTASLTGSVGGGTASLTGSTSFGSASHTHTFDGKGTKSYTTDNGFKYTEGDTVLALGQSYGTSGSSNSSVGISSTAASNGTLGVSNTAASNGTLAVDAGDAETAPNHIIVNTFVKVD